MKALKQIGLALLAIALILLTWGASAVRHRQQAQNTSMQHLVGASPTEDVVPVKQSYSNAPAPDEPEQIVLPTIGTTAFIQRVGVDQNHEIGVPDNIHLAGWFSESVKPGDAGLSIIDGHVTGKTQDGVFINLPKLRVGDHFLVVFGNGATKPFVVREIHEVATRDAAAVLYSQVPTIRNQVNLVTCAGSYRTNTGYDKRLIVVGEYVNG